MSSNKKEKVIFHINEYIHKIEKFFDTYKKQFNIISSIVLVIIAALVVYFVWYQPRQEERAEVAIYKAEQYFAQDSFALALTGDGMHDGILVVIRNYSFTKTANRAKYIAGICYLRIGDYDNAIKYLKKFKGKDKLVAVQALASIGDAYMEKNDFKNALSYYKKAVNKNPNDLLTPLYLLRTGMICEMENNWKDALKYYERIQKEYPMSEQAGDIEKRIEFVKTKLGK